MQHNGLTNTRCEKGTHILPGMGSPRFLGHIHAWGPVNEIANPPQAGACKWEGEGRVWATYPQFFHQNLPARWIIPPPGKNMYKCMEGKGSLWRVPLQFKERRLSSPTDHHHNNVFSWKVAIAQWSWPEWVPGLLWLSMQGGEIFSTPKSCVVLKTDIGMSGMNGVWLELVPYLG